jgi:hypothetical protein
MVHVLAILTNFAVTQQLLFLWSLLTASLPCLVLLKVLFWNHCLPVYIVTCYLVTRGFWILYLDLLDTSSGGIYT